MDEVYVNRIDDGNLASLIVVSVQNGDIKNDKPREDEVTEEIAEDSPSKEPSDNEDKNASPIEPSDPTEVTKDSEVVKEENVGYRPALNELGSTATKPEKPKVASRSCLPENWPFKPVSAKGKILKER